ncbi:hypothetical protein [Nocardia transvalensis]|uniref:hypothetical protein n=1 Tax=Nocardia transvalensis TaxID=37333 RepID=UPI0018953E80|nr:hypothetical protein [Nocardia transvalensis]MBF6333557.1 hypothetical protein [Nocardia transvalensis]
MTTPDNLPMLQKPPLFRLVIDEVSHVGAAAPDPLERHFGESLVQEALAALIRQGRKYAPFHASTDLVCECGAVLYARFTDDQPLPIAAVCPRCEVTIPWEQVRQTARPKHAMQDFRHLLEGSVRDQFRDRIAASRTGLADLDGLR